jgi:hypothetical protein
MTAATNEQPIFTVLQVYSAVQTVNEMRVGLRAGVEKLDVHGFTSFLISVGKGGHRSGLVVESRNLIVGSRNPFGFWLCIVNFFARSAVGPCLTRALPWATLGLSVGLERLLRLVGSTFGR